MVDPNEYLIELSEKLCPLVWEAPLGDLSKEEQVFVCVYELEREVNNGGFDQFFRNSFGQYARETVGALETIGAASMAELARTAVAEAFPPGVVPSDEDERFDALDSAGDDLVDKLNSLDQRFCEYPDDLTALLFAYVQANHESIRGATPA